MYIDNPNMFLMFTKELKDTRNTINMIFKRTPHSCFSGQKINLKFGLKLSEKMMYFWKIQRRQLLLFNKLVCIKNFNLTRNRSNIVENATFSTPYTVEKHKKKFTKNSFWFWRCKIFQNCFQMFHPIKRKWVIYFIKYEFNSYNINLQVNNYYPIIILTTDY